MHETDREQKTPGSEEGSRIEERRRWPRFGGSADEKPATSALKSVLGNLRQAREYAAYYLAAKKDRMTLSVRQALIWAAVGLLGAFLLLTAAATAVVLLLVGLSRGLEQAFGESAWLGPTVLGAGLILLVFATAAGAIWWLRRSFRRKAVEKYEKLQARQRAELGRDISGRVEGKV